MIDFICIGSLGSDTTVFRIIKILPIFDISRSPAHNDKMLSVFGRQQI